jgi:hypothetical protein
MRDPARPADGDAGPACASAGEAGAPYSFLWIVVMMPPGTAPADLLTALRCTARVYSQLRYIRVICPIIYVNLTQPVNRPFRGRCSPLLQPTPYVRTRKR